MKSNVSPPDSSRPVSIKEIFLAARKVTVGESRDRYLTEAIGDDQDLRRRIDRMLASEDCSTPRPLAQAVDNLDLAAYDVTTVPTIDVSEHPSIGPYKLLERLGTGGMGEVFVAEQRKPVRRTVALKLIKRGMDSKDVIARFEAERQALALMSHPNIASVLDAGQTEDGRPYFVMDLVRGIRITDYCDQHQLTVRQRLELVVTVCQAVQHAHQKGIIHRDLKPGNILVELDDVRHVPKVIDFGVAKATNQRLTEHTLFTQFSQMIGTPLYMSPEQAQMTSMDVDTRSDVYSLGVVLYELLTGSTPFDKKTLNTAGFDEMRRIIREDEPPRPSHRVSTLKAEQDSTLTERQQRAAPHIRQHVEAELDWIVMKALEKDRIRRYESASALAADVQRFLDGDLVQACPPSAGYRFRKYAKRHTGLLTTAGLLVATLMIATGISISYAMQADQAKGESNLEKSKAVAAQELAEKNFESALDAVDKLLAHASSPELAEIPQVQPIRKKILEDALTFYDQFRLTSGDSPKLRLRAAVTRRKLGDLAKILFELDAAETAFNEALVQIEELSRQYPDNVTYRDHLTWTLTALGYLHLFERQQPDEAQKYFERAKAETEQLVADHPDDDRLRNRHVSSLLAISSSCEPLGQLDRRLSLLLEASGYDSKSSPSIPLQKSLANALKSTDPGRSEEIYRTVISRSRNQIKEKPTRQRRSWHTSALLDAAELLQVRHDKDAETLAMEAVEIGAAMTFEFPRFPAYRHQLERAVNLHISLLADEASAAENAEIVRVYLDRFPGMQKLHKSYAGFLARQDDSLAALSQAIQQFPEQSVYYESRGTQFFERGRIDEAIADLKKVLQTTRETPNSEIGKRIALAAKELRNHGRFIDAVALAELAHEQGVVSYQVDVALYAAKFELHEYEEAITHINDAMEIYPGNPNWMFKRRAAAQFYLERFDDSLADLEKSLELNPNDLSAVAWIPVDDVANCPDEVFRKSILALADRGVVLNDRSPSSLMARVHVATAFGVWELARADVDAVVASEVATYYSLYAAALLSLAAHDLPRYEELCATMLDDFVESKILSEMLFTAWTCALAADAIEDYSPAISLARRVVKESPDKQQYLGAILMRSGQYAEARIELEKALAANESGKTSQNYARYFVAMTEHHLGQEQAAKDQLENANKSAADFFSDSPRWYLKLTLELLRKEAETLIGESKGVSAPGVESPTESTSDP